MSSSDGAMPGHRLPPQELHAAGDPQTPLRPQRVNLLQALLMVLGVIVVGNLAWRQLFGKGPNGLPPQLVRAAPGSIVDATGHYLVAAVPEFTLGISPNIIDPALKPDLAMTLTSLLGLPLTKTTEVLAQDVTYARLATNVPVAVVEELLHQDLRIARALDFQSIMTRIYPDSSLAASVLSFVGMGDAPPAGLEGYYQTELRGRDGKWQGVYGVLMSPTGYEPAQDGADLVLTLDRNVQQMAEMILQKGIEQSRASSGVVVVLEPKTGAVLAMANRPTFRPDRYWDDYEKSPEEVSFENLAITAPVEPGSVFKPLTLVAALNHRVIDRTFVYDDAGRLDVAPGVPPIQNWDRQAHGRTNLVQLLAHSLNVGAARVAMLLGPTRFYETMMAFGFSERTGVDLAFEASGTMRVPGNPYWSISDLARNSFGHALTATPLQVACAYGAIANKGVLMRPRIVGETRSQGQVKVNRPMIVRRVVSEQAAQDVTAIMAEAIELGLSKVTLPGYRLAGKSGTAEIPDVSGYRSADVVASFVGFLPLPDPRFVILVQYSKPREGLWGADVAAPAFRELAAFLLNYYGIPPTQ